MEFHYITKLIEDKIIEIFGGFTDDIVIALESLGKHTGLDYLSVLLSGVAIYSAIQIPNKIAEQQNKIALFDKRLTLYKEVERFLLVGIAIDMAIGQKEKYGETVELNMKPEFYGLGVQNHIKNYTHILLKLKEDIGIEKQDFKENFWIHMSAYSNTIKSATSSSEFLFSKKISEDFKTLISNYCDFTLKMDKCSFEDIKNMAEEFNCFRENQFNEIKELLSLDKNNRTSKVTLILQKITKKMKNLNCFKQN